jgi:hypothetical protein
MIGKTTRLFGLLGPDLAANRLYQMYNYIFELNGVDAAFINISVPSAKMAFTLENLGSSEIESLLISPDASTSDEIRMFFGTDEFVLRVDIKEGVVAPVCAQFAPSDDEESLLEAAKLNFFEWFGFFPNIADDTTKTLRESAPRESILTRSE